METVRRETLRKNELIADLIKLKQAAAAVLTAKRMATAEEKRAETNRLKEVAAADRKKQILCAAKRPKNEDEQIAVPVVSKNESMSHSVYTQQQ